MKLKKAAQSDRQLRAQHAGRDHRRDRIGGVVQAVQEIERERDADQRDQMVKVIAVHQAWSITMPWISSATSSKPVEHPLEMAVDLAADEEVHRPLRAVRLEQRLEAGVVELVGLALEMDDRLGDLVQPGGVAADVAQQRHRLEHQPRRLAGERGSSRASAARSSSPRRA